MGMIHISASVNIKRMLQGREPLLLAEQHRILRLREDLISELAQPLHTIAFREALESNKTT